MSIDGLFSFFSFLLFIINRVVLRVRMNIGVNVDTIRNKIIKVIVVTIIASVGQYK